MEAVERISCEIHSDEETEEENEDDDPLLNTRHSNFENLLVTTEQVSEPT